MATVTKKPSTRKSAAKKPAGTRKTAKTPRRAADDPLERVERSIDAAEAALKDLRVGTEKGTRDLMRDLEQTLKHARANAQRVGTAISKDVQKAMRAESARRRKPTR